jgi:hypothetical protein
LGGEAFVWRAPRARERFFLDEGHMSALRKSDLRRARFTYISLDKTSLLARPAES